MFNNPYLCTLHLSTLFGLNFLVAKTYMDALQIINTFADSVMSVCATKTEIIAGSVDGTVRTFDIRMGRYVISIVAIT